MKKYLKRLKKLIVLLVFTITFNAFSAIVGDNDGAAFITKSEFDSLKNDFQAQINNYNSSIDAKLEGAIASYLAGIQIARKLEQNIINYDKDGILAPRNMEDIKWSEGTISFAGWATDTHLTANTSGHGAAYLSWNGVSASPFGELLVSDVDYTNGTAIWQGRVNSNIKVKFSGYGWSTAAIGSAYRTSSVQYSRIAGLWRRSNVDLSSNTGTLFNIFHRPNNVNATSTNGALIMDVKAVDVKLIRNIVNDKYYNKNIISVPKADGNRSFGFTNKDEFRDWCNDWVKLYNQTSKRKQLKHSSQNPVQGLGNGSGQTRIHYSNSFPTTNVTVYPYTLTGDQGTTSYTVENDTYAGNYKPYVGFVQTIDEWNKLCTSAYDSHLDDMFKYHPDLNVITTKSGDQHLAISAGYPFLLVKKDQKVIIPIRFDKKVDFDLWFKVGSFSNSEEVTDKNAKDRITKITGKNIVSATRSNAVKLKGGEGKVEFTMPKEGYVFFKWTIADSSTLGGGTFYPERTVELTYEN